MGVVKRSLRKVIGKACLTNVHFLTFIKKAEALINSRLLVYVDEDINSKFTLTPLHFLTLNPKIGLHIYTQDDNDDAEYTPEISLSDRHLNT